MDELTSEQIEELRADLLALGEDLRLLLSQTAAGARPVGLDQPIGRLSRMDALQQQSMVQANIRAAQRRLEQAEAALQRIAPGEYGFCLECDEAIGFARLKARPESPFCLSCQGRREQRR